MAKRVVAAFLLCAVMVLVAAVPLVGADTHHVVKGSQGPRASAVSWLYEPVDFGIWKGHVVNSGLKSIAVDVSDVTTGAATLILHQRIRFAAYPSNVVDTDAVIVAKGHVYNITVTPSGPKGSSCTFDDSYVIPPPPPVALFTMTISGGTVMVDGSTSYDISGVILEWAWDWGDGSISGPSATPTATHTYLSSGAYTIELTVLSSTGQTGSASHMITTWPPPPPVTFTCTVSGFTVMVDASANYQYPPIVSYDWNWGDGSTGTGVTATHTYAGPGTYTITLTVTDAIGQTNSVSKTLYLGGGMPPVMAFTYTVGGYAVTVDASSSTDDIGIVSYAWDWGDGTTGIGMIATHTYTAAGPYIVTLTVTDTAGHTSSMSRYVLGGSYLSPKAAFTTTVGSDSRTVTVDGSASTGVGLSYAWNWGDQWTSTGVTHNHIYWWTAEFTITLTVTDTFGHTNSVSETVHVVAPAIPPLPFIVYGHTFASDSVTPLPDCTISVTNVRMGETLIGIMSDFEGLYSCDLSFHALGGDTLLVHAISPAGQSGSSTGVVSSMPYLGIDVTLSAIDMPAVAAFALTASDVVVDFDASASTDDQGIVSYLWDFGDGTAGTGLLVTHTYTIPPVMYNVTLTGIDFVGLTATVIREVVLSPPNNPPVAGYTWTANGLIVVFDAASSYDDGIVVSYSWNFGDGNTGSGVMTNHIYSASGTYGVVLIVTDDDGATGTQSQSVTVSYGSQMTLLSDSFDGGIAGWTLTTSGGPITLDTSTGMAAAPSMKLFKQQSAGSTLATHSFATVTAGHVSAEANLKVDAASTAPWNWTYFNLYNVSGVVQTYFGFIGGQMSYYTATLGWQPIGVAYIADTWYNIRFDVNLGTGTYDIYVNAALKMSGAPLWGSGPHSVSSVGFQAGTYNDLFGMTMWVDGVNVSCVA